MDNDEKEIKKLYDDALMYNDKNAKIKLAEYFYEAIEKNDLQLMGWLLPAIGMNKKGRYTNRLKLNIPTHESLTNEAEIALIQEACKRETSQIMGEFFTYPISSLSKTSLPTLQAFHSYCDARALAEGHGPEGFQNPPIAPTGGHGIEGLPSYSIVPNKDYKSDDRRNADSSCCVMM